MTKHKTQPPFCPSPGLLAAAAVFALLQVPAGALPPGLSDYDPSGHLPNGAGTVTVKSRGSDGHRELFRKLIPGEMLERGKPGEPFVKRAPPVFREGEVYRFFLEPFVQGINHFLHAIPDATDVSFIGLSGVVRKLGAGRWAFHSDATHKSHIISPHVLEQVIVPVLIPDVKKKETQ